MVASMALTNDIDDRSSSTGSINTEFLVGYFRSAGRILRWFVNPIIHGSTDGHRGTGFGNGTN
jgi:hypothetical protein